MSLAILFHFLCAQHVSDIGVVSVLQAEVCNTDTTPNQPHRNSNTYRTKNNTTNVVIQQNSRKLLMMDIVMSETCWAHKKWNKSDIKLFFYSSAITMTHGPINMRLWNLFMSLSDINVCCLRIVDEWIYNWCTGERNDGEGTIQERMDDGRVEGLTEDWMGGWTDE